MDMILRRYISHEPKVVLVEREVKGPMYIKKVEDTRPLTLNTYQHQALSTAVYPGRQTKSGIEYNLFGLLGEAGELANKYKKIIRNEDNPYAHREALMSELGDVLWYAAVLADELGYDFSVVAESNLAKLRARKTNGELKEHARD
jgi:NTP pyrophosphatase (non-canonical NTP hydrolase)